ncbi:hypothetical protein DD557_06320 [Thalassobacter stenotrophicus]|nr:hypothetical protein DD557_06320 [Thalassobacter stenotrophicus]
MEHNDQDKNKFSREMHDRAVQLVLDNADQHGLRWQAVLSTSAKTGCSIAPTDRGRLRIPWRPKTNDWIN